MIRIATPADAAEIAEIYAPNVSESFISFEEIPPDAEAFARRMTAGLPRHPWLVAEEGGRITGYAYAGPHNQRAAYRWSAEATVYVRRGCERRGIGRALYARLLEILKSQGLRAIYAGVALPNPASVAFHESMGFAPAGAFPAAGFKQGWHDVGWWALDLGAPAGGEAPPPEPIPFAELVRQGRA